MVKLLFQLFFAHKLVQFCSGLRRTLDGHQTDIRRTLNRWARLISGECPFNPRCCYVLNCCKLHLTIKKV